MPSKNELKKEIMDNLREEIKEEFVQDVKKKIKEKLKQEISVELDIEEYIEDEVGYNTDLEMWVENLKAIFETIDLSEELSLETLNEKFEELVNVCAALVVQVRIVKQYTKDLEEQLKATKGYGLLGEMAQNYMTAKEQIDHNENKDSIYL